MSDTNQSTDYINKIKEFRITKGSFKSDSGDEVKFKTTSIIIEIDGEEQTLALSGSNAVKPAILEIALKGADGQA